MDGVTSCYSDVTTGIDDYSSYTTAYDETTSVDSSYFQSAHETTGQSSFSFSDLASLSLSDTEFVTKPAPEKMCLHIHCDGRTEESIRQLYQPLFDWVDTNGCLYNVVNEKNMPSEHDIYNRLGLNRQSNFDLNSNSNQNQNCRNGVHQPTVEIPALAIILFLTEDAMVGSERVDMASTVFDKKPWKFHHSESISRGKINAYPYNNQNYYTAGPNDPLCSIRQIHCGKQHVRLVRFTSIDTWQEQINLYSLFLGQVPDVNKSDFCMFTVSNHDEYDIQLALKKVPPEIKCRESQAAALGFTVVQVGDLVPLLPHICIPNSDTRWITTDLDGNKIYLDVAKPSRDSDSGVSSLYPEKNEPQFRISKPKKHKSKPQKNFSVGNESDTSSVITDLDAFMKSILQPMMEHRRSETPSSMSDSANSFQSDERETSLLSKSSSKSLVKSVRFNHVGNYLTDYTYPTNSEYDAQTDQDFDNEADSSHVTFTAPPPVKNGYHLYYNDTDEESYLSEAGVDTGNPNGSLLNLKENIKPNGHISQDSQEEQEVLQSLSGFYI